MILDFPGTGHNRDRLVFGAPRAILAARSPGAVRPALRRAEQEARAGAWVVGYIAYEAAPAFDPALRTRAPEPPAPLLWFGVFDAPDVTTAPLSVPDVEPPAWRPDVTRTGYDRAVADIRDAIAAGSVYQVNHTFRMRAACDIDPAALHDALVGGGHGTYHALIETPGWAIVSASPELFFEVNDRTITTRPMKGTARRGRWPEEDARSARSLAASAKDRAENLMIVDLLRNDLGRIAQFGSVAVTDMFAIESYPTVHQMTSTITARLADGIMLDDIFAAVFPCGSVTGAPKIAAMQHIAELETSPRSAYCGSIGVIRPDGSTTFNVAIRTVVMDTAARTAAYGAGGGITWDSSAAAEYEEAIGKAAMITERVPDFALLETMRLENGTILRRDLHLARLAASAAYWNFDAHVGERAAAALARHCAEAATGAWRIRLTAARDGSIDITRTPLTDVPGRPPQATHGGIAPLPQVALAGAPVHSRDRLLHHKTTARAVYDAFRAQHPEALDVLLFNEHRCITEFTNGNVVCEIAGQLVTPPRAAGLLAGTFRAQLLADGVVVEREMNVEQLRDASRVWRINSVREWVEVAVTDDV